MKRAASFGRAPVMPDVEIASSLLGYQGDVDPAFAQWRTGAVHGADHEYGVRRAIVDAVPDAVLRMPPQVPALLGEFRAELQTLAGPPTRTDVVTRPVLARAHGLAPRRQRAHGAVQLAVRPPPRRRRSSCASRTPTSPRSRERVGRRHPGHAALARPRLGRRPAPARATRFDVYLAAADRLLAGGHAYECYCTEDEVRGAQRRGASPRAARRATTATAATSRADERAALRGRGPAAHRSGSAPPTRASARFTDLIRGEVRGRVGADPRLRDRAVRRLADLLPRQRGRRHRHGHHPRDPRRGPHRLDPPGARAPAPRSAAASRPVYAHLPLIVDAESRAKLSKRHGAVALEDFVADGLPPRGARQLPRAARVGARRRRQRGADARRARRRSSTSTASRTPRRRSTATKLDWMNGEWIRRLDARRAASRGCEPDRAGAVRRRVRPRRGRAGGRRSGRSGRSRSCRSSTRWRSSSSPTTTSRSRPSRGTSWSRRPNASRRCSTRSIAHVESCEWTVDALDLQPVDRRARPEAAARRCPRSTPRSRASTGASRCSTRCDLLGRDRDARPAPRAPASAWRDAGDASASLAVDLRGWCNRQHNRFWSCLWGFESSPPSSQQCSRSSLAPSSSGPGRRPLKAVTAVRICSGLHTEARFVSPRMGRASPRRGARTRLRDAARRATSRARARRVRRDARVRALDATVLHAISTTSRARLSYPRHELRARARMREYV